MPESPWGKGPKPDPVHEPEVRKAKKPARPSLDEILANPKGARAKLEASATLRPIDDKIMREKLAGKIAGADEIIELVLDAYGFSPAVRATYFAEKLAQTIAPECEDSNSAVASVALFASHTVSSIRSFKLQGIIAKILGPIFER